MDKTQLLNQFAKDSDMRQLFASALDKAEQAERRQMPCHSPFFTQEEQMAFSALLARGGQIAHCFLGGYPQAQRKLCYFPAPWQDLEDLSWVEEGADLPLVLIQGRFHGDLSHRDILGSLMALGLQRSKFGDILVQDQLCQVLVLAETAPVVLSQWSGAGRSKIQCQEIPLGALVVPEQAVKEIHCTLSSLRLDAVVAAAFSLSRSAGSGMISGGRVSLNHSDCHKVDKLVAEGDVLVCRGLGKCLLAEVKGLSKKGRTAVCLHRYL